MLKRIVLFLATNLAVILVLSVVLRLLGVDRILDESGAGINYEALLILSLVIGFGGSFISLAMSKWMAKRSTGAQVITQPRNEVESWLLSVVERQARQAGYSAQLLGWCRFFFQRLSCVVVGVGDAEESAATATEASAAEPAGTAAKPAASAADAATDAAAQSAAGAAADVLEHHGRRDHQVTDRVDAGLEDVLGDLGGGDLHDFVFDDPSEFERFEHDLHRAAELDVVDDQVDRLISGDNRCFPGRIIIRNIE